VIPASLVGLVLFAATLGPGLVFVLVVERRRLRAERSQLLEAAEVLSIGAVSSGLAALAVIAIADRTGWIGKGGLDRGRHYLIDHPVRSLTALLAAFVLSCALALAAGRIVTWRLRSTLRPGRSVWYEVFSKRGDNMVRVTAELRDGRRVMGFLKDYTIDMAFPAERQIALHEPIYVQRPTDLKPNRLPDRVLILQADELLYVGARFEKPQAPPQSLAEPSAVVPPPFGGRVTAVSDPCASDSRPAEVPR
jgi:Family of unknown function (DUF6338)